jgi:ABC-2 type transport system permease protein
LAGWIKPFAENQPITHVIEAARGLMLNQPIGDSAWLAVAWCVGAIVVAMPVAAYLFRKKTIKV